MRKYLLAALALAGMGVAVVAVVADRRPAPPVSSGAGGVRAPYDAYVAGTGLVEARSGNIAVGTPVSGILVAIYVERGAAVRQGDALFKIDDRDLEAQLPAARAAATEAAAKLALARYELKIAASLRAEQVISDEELARRRFETASFEAVLAARQAEVGRLQAEIERRTVRAPVAGRVLQLEAHVGEFAESAVLDAPLLVLGDDSRLYVRVDVDENDAWRVRPGAAATGYLRGGAAKQAELRFERIEPLLVPKRSLTGASVERADTRVLQVLYSFERTALPVYIGQQVDVWIAAATLP
ncbi:MAG: efflux RND transporter periplasmic adaptor subunit [Thermoanaerobaculia bacterium]